MTQIAEMFYPKRRVIAVTQVGLFLFLLLLSLILISPANAQQSNTISGLVFDDLNLNETFDLHDIELAGWSVNLYKDSNLVATGVADDAGRYSFNAVGAGSYTVSLEVPNAWAAVSDKSVTVDFSSGPNVQVNFANYRIVAEQINSTGPFGGMSISNQNIERLSPTSVKITWFTNRLATSQVVFDHKSIEPSSVVLGDNNIGYAYSSDFDFTAVTFHTVILDNLDPGDTYNYRIISLPNPTQWRGASRTFNLESNFVTSEMLIEPGNENTEEDTLGVVKGVESTSTPTSTAMATDKMGNGAEKMKNEEMEDEEMEDEAAVLARAGPEKNCTTYIWILLILNTIAIAYAASKSKGSNRENVSNAWWVLAILLLIPTILGYAECWLVIWMLIMLIAEVIVISSLGNKKQGQPPSQE